MDQDTEFAEGAAVAPPASRGRRLAARFVGWLRDWLFWDERVPGAVYRDVVQRLADTRAELLATQIKLSVERAGRVAAAQEVQILAAVCKRNEERVQAEIAGAAAAREANLSAEARKKLTRTGGAD